MSEPLIWLIIGCLAGILLIRYYQKLHHKHSLKKISQRAKIGESEAENLLKKKGYHIIGEQVRMPVSMMIDHEKYESYVKADFIVEKHHKRYLVEVKTGKQANVHLPNVHRQLFEYQNIFKTDGILFVDMNNYDIIEVSFMLEKNSTIKSEYFFGGLFIGVCTMLFVFSYL